MPSTIAVTVCWNKASVCLGLQSGVPFDVSKNSKLGRSKSVVNLDLEGASACWILVGFLAAILGRFSFSSATHTSTQECFPPWRGAIWQPAGTRRRVWDEVVLPRPAGGRASSGMSVSQIVPEQILLENLLKLDD